MRVVATVCSKKKQKGPVLLPAVRRYVGAHIRYVEYLAQGAQVGYYILSGKHGFIPAGFEIEYYDYYLEFSAVPSLAKKVVEHLHTSKIKEIDFYVEPKASWQPYIDTMVMAATEAKVKLNQYTLPRQIFVEAASTC